mgnify:CR=1 FL=1
MLPAGIVDRICDARQEVIAKMSEVRAEEIEEKKRMLGKEYWVFRGTEYSDCQSASKARERAAYEAYSSAFDEAQLAELLKTPPVQAARTLNHGLV